MSLPLQAQQGIQRSFAAALRFKSSISLHHQGVAAEADISANSTSTHSCDTSEETSLYDPIDMDPFKHEPCPPSSSFGCFYEADPSDNSSFSASPRILSPTSSTQSLPEMMDVFNVSAPPSPDTLSLKEKTVVRSSNENSTSTESPPQLEHNEIQRKIRRVFELVMNGGHHLKEMMTLTKDIETHFIQAPGVITDPECSSDESIHSSSSSAPPVIYSDNGYPFPVMPSPQSPKTLALISEDDETLVSESPTSTFEPNNTPPMTSVPLEPANKSSRIPRFRLPPLLIVKTPSLASISSYTLSPTPTQTSLRRGPLARSFSAPILFANRDRSSRTPALASPMDKAAHSAKARMSYIPVRKDSASGLLSPKIRVKFDFEPPDDMTPSPTKSRFSASSSLIPTPVRDRWYRPKFNLGDLGKGWMSYTRPKKFIPSSSKSFSRSFPSVSEQVQPTPSGGLGDENHAHFKRTQFGRSQQESSKDNQLPVTASGRWSTDWEGLLAKIGNEGDTGESSESAMVLRRTTSMDSLNAAESPQATALLLPRGPAQIRKASSPRVPERSHRRFGGIFSGGHDPLSKVPPLPTKPTSKSPPDSGLQDPSFVEIATSAVPIKKAVECQVHLPSILSVLDDAVDSKKSNGVVRMLSMASRMSRMSSLGPKGRAQRSSLMLKPPSATGPSVSLPIIRSSFGSRSEHHSTARCTLESGGGDILESFPDPPRAV